MEEGDQLQFLEQPEGELGSGLKAGEVFGQPAGVQLVVDDPLGPKARAPLDAVGDVPGEIRVEVEVGVAAGLEEILLAGDGGVEVGGEAVTPLLLDPQGELVPLGGGLKLLLLDVLRLDLLAADPAVVAQEEHGKLHVLSGAEKREQGHEHDDDGNVGVHGPGPPFAGDVFEYRPLPGECNFLRAERSRGRMQEANERGRYVSRWLSYSAHAGTDRRCESNTRSTSKLVFS